LAGFAQRTSSTDARGEIGAQGSEFGHARVHDRDLLPQQLRQRLGHVRSVTQFFTMPRDLRE
jgi:hypothetical protein